VRFVPEVAAKPKEAHTKERKFERWWRPGSRPPCWCWCI